MAIRIHKRYITVTVIVLLAVILVAALVLRSGTRLTADSALFQFEIKDPEQNVFSASAGVSLKHLSGANLLQDASFEPYVYRKCLTVYNGDDSVLAVSSEEAGAEFGEDDFFNGAQARIMTQTDDGLKLKKTASVAHFGINRVGLFQPLELPEPIKPDSPVLDFVRFKGSGVAVGQKGLIVKDIEGQSAAAVDIGYKEHLTGAGANQEWLAVCSEQGDLLFTDNFRDWTIQYTDSGLPLRSVALNDRGIAVAVGDKGSMVIGSQNGVCVINAFSQNNLTDICFGLSLFVAVGQNDTILVSQNGLVWRQAYSEKADDWQAIDYRDGRFVVVGRQGTVLASEDGLNFHALAPLPESPARDILLLSRQQMIALTGTGSFFVSNDSGLSWLESALKSGMNSRVISLAGQDKILSSDQSGQIGISELVAEIRLDSSLDEGEFQSGDLVFLEKNSFQPPAMLLENQLKQKCIRPWEKFGGGELNYTDQDHAPQAGSACLALVNDSDGQASVLSQTIDPGPFIQMNQNTVLQLSIWLKQEDVADRSVDIWLSGPFGQIGTKLTNVSGNWKKYTYAFVIPPRPGGYGADDIRFNLAIAGGTLYLDRVFLGPLNEHQEQMPVWLKEQIEAIGPQIIRLELAGIGGRTVPAENWYQVMYTDFASFDELCLVEQTGMSLAAGLTMALENRADPWLTIDSYATETDLTRLLEYLGAPISEPYGKVRQNLGMALPWTGQFQKIYLEFLDKDGVWSTDRLRADAVNRMIQAAVKSNYYQKIKAKIVFVDGMHYEDGLMLSRADFHASDLNAASSGNGAFDAYLDNIPRNPDKPSDEFPELIRAAYLQSNRLEQTSLADFASLFLKDLGRHSGQINIARPENDDKHLLDLWSASATISAQAVRGMPLAVERLDTLDDESIEVFGFSDSSGYRLVITNRSTKTRTCQLVTDLPLKHSTLEKYDENGVWLGSQTLTRTNSRISMLPGSVAVIQKISGERKDG